MRGPEKLLEHEDRWVTRMGKWFSGERVVYRGQDLHVDLADMDWMELYLYGITGRRFDERQRKVLTAIWTYTSYPEPRIWNNRIVALAGTAKSTATLGISAGISASEASIYGHRPSLRAIDFFIRTKKKLERGEHLAELVKKELENYRGIYGYGRPITREDERISHMVSLVKEVDFDKGFYVRLAFEIEKILLEGGWRMRMNIAGLGAALAADMGFTPEEFHLFKIPCFIAGMAPCSIEANSRSEGSFFPLRCTRIAYEGAVRREWGVSG